MGTRSNIIAMTGENEWQRIYCHWDGYISHNGVILSEHYRNRDKIKQLMELGNLSVLGKEIGTKHPFGSGGADECTAYGRDRGDVDMEAKKGLSLAAIWPEPDTWVEYVYVWGGSDWSVGYPSGGVTALTPIKEAIEGGMI
jgi:hypothetical protein